MLKAAHYPHGIVPCTHQLIWKLVI